MLFWLVGLMDRLSQASQGWVEALGFHLGIIYSLFRPEIVY